MVEKQFYRPDEVAKILSVSTNFVYRLIVTGKLPAVKIGSVWRIHADAICGICAICDIATVFSSNPQ
jgi:excisionase family DNA binding protein